MHLFLFFRDFRLDDNVGLIATLQKYECVVPVFVFTPEQIEAKRNPYFSNPSVQFLCESLEAVDRQMQGYGGRLCVFYGELEEVLTAIRKRGKIESLSFNMDYTPYARRRTDRLKGWCKAHGVLLGCYEDYLLRPMGSFLRADGSPYRVYGAFRDKVKRDSLSIGEPNCFKAFRFDKAPMLEGMTYGIDELGKLYRFSDRMCLRGGREEGRRLLRELSRGYGEHRNMLGFTTSHLAPYIKYGCVSVREVLYAFMESVDEALYDQLIWREFYTYIAYYFPDMLRGMCFQKRYDKMVWDENEVYLRAWQEGKTGYPVVDACMRELNVTGYMHNRGRLICANFLNRLLHLDWRLGERYFAQRLIDYDPAVNNGNWQWVASVGVDPKPYFQRLFNPFLQGKRFDPEAVYMKKWLPELRGLPAGVLHAWDEYYSTYDLEKIGYYAPIVRYKEARARSMAYYRGV